MTFSYTLPLIVEVVEKHLRVFWLVNIVQVNLSINIAESTTTCLMDVLALYIYVYRCSLSRTQLVKVYEPETSCRQLSLIKLDLFNMLKINLPNTNSIAMSLYDIMLSTGLAC